MLGAISVLATVTPISARDAAIFTGRLLLRLADFVPLIAGSGQRWSDVITGLLRMAYVTDVLRSFRSKGWLTEDKYRDIHIQANTAINARRTDWFEEVLSSISKETGISLPEVESFRKEPPISQVRFNTYISAAPRKSLSLKTTQLRETGCRPATPTKVDSMRYWKDTRRARCTTLPYRVGWYPVSTMPHISVASWPGQSKVSRTAQCTSKTGHLSRSKHHNQHHVDAREEAANESAMAGSGSGLSCR